MDICRDIAAGFTDLRAHKDLVTLFDQGLCRSTDVLTHKDAYLRGQRHRDGLACSGCFVMRRMRAKRRTFQLVQHGIKIPHSELDCRRRPHADAQSSGSSCLI